MDHKLSILKAREELDADTNRSDVAAAFLKALSGCAPYIGPFLAEAIGMIIPKQKMDRLSIFAQVLDDKVKYLEQDTAKLKMQTEGFLDLLEDGLIQASRAMSDERRNYIASILKNSITNEELTHVEEKKLLSLLGGLNDAEIITLKFHSLSQTQKREFVPRHRNILGPVKRTLKSQQADVDKGALQDSYRNKLMEVGLLELVYKRQDKGKTPEFDEKTGRMKATSLKVTLLGKLLLRYIDQAPTSEGDGTGTG